ncbi:MAG: class I SAM-dependent methyltransferase [Thermoproteota archaeon]
MTASYNPREYWLARGKVYKEQFKHDPEKQLQEGALLDYLKTITPPFQTIIEVGCGFGRISKIILSNFPGIQEYLAVDMSPDQLENAKRYVKSDIIRFRESDIQSLQLDKKYDLVIAVSVLLHVLPSEIDQVVSKLVSFSKMHVVNVDYYENNKPKQIAPHNFMHQYEAIYKSLSSVKSVKRIPIVKKKTFSMIDIKQSIFHAVVVEPDQ